MCVGVGVGYAQMIKVLHGGLSRDSKIDDVIYIRPLKEDDQDKGERETKESQRETRNTT